MNIYRYRAIDSNGKVISGFIRADDEALVINNLSLRNLHVISISEIPRFISPVLDLLSGKVKNVDLIEFAKNMAIMMKAGIPITVALDDIGENLSKSKLKNVVLNIRDLIDKGISLSEAISYHSDVFPQIFVNLVKIGEETGRLDKSFEDIAEHFQKIEDLKTAIKRALIYPIFATVASVGAMGFWIVYVLPKIVAAMKSMNVKIPFITSLLVEFGLFVQKFFYIFPIFVVFLLFLFHIYRKNPKFRYLRSYLSFKVPVFKQILYTRAVALFCEQMRILVEAGIPIDNTLEMTAQVVNNELMSRAIYRVKDKIATGKTISESLIEEEIFPNLVIRLINVGETSGRLEEQLDFLTKYYTAYLQEYSARLGKVIEPIMIGMIGLFFAIVLYSLLSPLYDLISKLGKV